MSISMDYITNLVITYGTKIIIGLILLFIGFKVANKIASIAKHRLDQKDYDQTLVDFVFPFVRIGLKVLVLLAVIGYLGVQTTSFVAVIGGLSFAIGLAFQGSLANFAGGVLLIVFRPFKVGDFIEVSGHKGTVKSITIFYTYLTTVDNKQIVIPNSTVSNDSLTNFSINSTRRLDLTVGVDYATKIDDMKETIRKIVKKDELILNDPEPVIGLGEYGDNSINFHVKVWVNASDYWTVFYKFQEEIKRTFDAEGIEFPYPHMDVNIYKNIGVSKDNG